MESIEEGQGTIFLGLAQEGKQWIAIRISDTGAGLSPQEMAHIFDPDYTTKEKGLGLGLTFAHEIVQAHGGEIQVQSEPGKGTTFAVLLPVKAQGVRSREQGAGRKRPVES
jgi:signal transduction histidine kinase